MTIALVDDQILSQILRKRVPRILVSKTIFTTGYWYVRLCQAVLNANDRMGVLSRPLAELPTPLRDRAIQTVLELPDEIGIVSLRDLAPSIAGLRRDHQLNILTIEALAAAIHLDAQVYLSAPSPLLEQALSERHVRVKILPSK